MKVSQALAQRNRATENYLGDRDPEEDKLDAQELSDDEWVCQQDEELESNKVEDVAAMVQQGFNKPTPIIPSGSTTPTEQQPSILTARNDISGGISLFSDHRNSITSKEIIQPKRTNRD